MSLEQVNSLFKGNVAGLFDLKREGAVLLGHIEDV